MDIVHDRQPSASSAKKPVGAETGDDVDRSLLHVEPDAEVLLFPKTAQSRIHFCFEGTTPLCRAQSGYAFGEGCACHKGLECIVAVKPFRKFCDLCFELVDEKTQNDVIGALQMQSNS